MKRNKIASIPRDWLVWEWLLNWNALDTNDWTKNNWTATNVTYSNTEIGYQKQSWVFNGSAKIWTNYAPSIWASNFTNNIWYNWTVSSSAQYIFSNYDWTATYFILYVAWAAWAWWIVAEMPSAQMILTSLWIQDWKWHMITFLRKGSSLVCYVDSIQKWIVSVSSNAWNWQQIYLWRRWDDDNPMTWKLQWYRFYNYAISQQEIQTLYQEWLRQLWEWSDWILSSAITHYDFLWDANDVIWGNNWTVSWATLTTDRFWISKGYDFNGGSDYIWTPSIASLITWKNTLSYETMFFLDSSLWSSTTIRVVWNWQFLVGRFDWISLDNWFAVFTSSWTACNATSAFSTWQWVHLVWTYDWANIKLYINWVLDNTVAKTWNISSSVPSDTWSFWALSTIGSSAPDWKISYDVIWDRTLSAGEVKQLYDLSSKRYLNQFKKTLPLNLKGWLQLYIPWDNNSWTYYDLSWNWINLTATDVITTRLQQHKINNFNWTSSRITTPSWANALDFTWSSVEFSINFWINTSDTWWYIFAWTDWDNAPWYWIWINLWPWAVSWQISLYDWNWIQTWITINDSKWKFVSFTKSWANIKIYINWALLFSSSWWWNPTSYTTWTRDIMRSSNWANYISWLLKDLIIYNKVLTSLEIQELYYSEFIL